MTQTATAKKKHPKGLYLLFFTEMWERFGFYLMLGILYLYMTDNLKGGLGFLEGTANDIYGTYIALVYLTPFIGGLLADRIFGYRKTIIAGGATMAAGYLALAIPGETSFYVALGLIIVGNGLFKPNISTLLGNLYNKEEYVELKDKGYNIFYMGINIGAFFCNFVAAWLRNEYGWGYAFAAAGIGMILGLIIFASKQGILAEADKIKPVQKEDMSMSRIMMTIFVPAIGFAILGFFAGQIFGIENIFGSTSNDTFLFACIPVIYFYASTYRKASAEDKKPVGSLLYIFAVVVVFWAIFHQNGNVLTAWAEKNTWRPMPESVLGFANKVGAVQDVDAVPNSVESKEIRPGEWKHTLYIAADVSKEKADSLLGVIQADSTLAINVVRRDTTLLATAKGTATIEIVNTTLSTSVKDRVEGAKLATTLSAKKIMGELVYNKYLSTLPKDQWPELGTTVPLVSTELFQSLNPMFVVLFTPLVIAIFSFLVNRRRGFSTPGKIALGLLITGLSTIVMIFAVKASNNGAEKVSAMWLVGTYAVITFGELCLSPMGLSLVSKLSPARLTAVMMGGWFLSTAIGNKLAGVLGHMGSDNADKSMVFWINLCGALLCSVLLFIFVKKIRGVVRAKTGHD